MEIENIRAIYNKKLESFPDLSDCNLKTINDKKPYSKEEEFEAFNNYKKGDLEARNKIVVHNYGLVAKIAKSMFYSSFYSRVTLDDMIQNGFIGLIEAIDRFDVNKGYKFSTYATWWIWRSINTFTSYQTRIINLPFNEHEKTRKFQSFIKKYELEYGMEPTDEIISKSLNISLNSVKKYKMFIVDIRSLDYVIDIEDNGAIGTLGELIDDKNCNVENDALNNVFYDREEIFKYIKEILNEKEFNVILYRYGFYNNRPYSLEEIGKIHKLTRERIRQIELSAIKKLRRDSEFLKRFDESNDKIKKIRR